MFPSLCAAAGRLGGVVPVSGGVENGVPHMPGIATLHAVGCPVAGAHAFDSAAAASAMPVPIPNTVRLLPRPVSPNDFFRTILVRTVFRRGLNGHVAGLCISVACPPTNTPRNAHHPIPNTVRLLPRPVSPNDFFRAILVWTVF